jgi:micrococcal nuclease
MDWSNVDDNVKELSFVNELKEAKVVSVYDGDTIKVVFPLAGELYKWNCRLEHVDTPELRTKNENEKKYGYIVRDKLREKILNKVVKIKCNDFDKYGRLLVEILQDDDVTVNKWLIDNNYAFKYDGGTKENWEEYLNNSNLLS